MIYIINLAVIFDPDNRLLTLKNDTQYSISLSKPATRLLSELVVNNRTNLARDDLLKSVWEDYGFSPSNANLNNHVSELRKAFISLGMGKDIISTVPRVGLRMDADIYPEVKSPSEVILSNEVVNNASGTIFSKMVTLIEQPPRRFLLNKNLIITIFTTISCMLIFCIVMVCFFNYSRGEDISLLITHRKCSVYNLGETKPYNNDAVKIIKKMESEGVGYSREDIDIFYIETDSNKESVKIRLIAACSKVI